MTRRRPIGGLKGKAGIALPMVLLLTTVLGFTMLAVITSLIGLRRETASARDNAEFERAALTAEARFAFLAITEPMGSDGLYIDGVRDQGRGAFPGYAIPQLSTVGSVLSADGRLYRWKEDPSNSQDFRVGIQDEAGLINLYQADVDVLTRVFQAVGLGDTDATNLANELIAYNADPTAHQPMRRPSQLYRLEDAPTLIPDKIWRKLSDQVVTYPDSTAANINTASADVLKAWFNLDDATAAGIVSGRVNANGLGQNKVYTSPDQAGVPPLPGQPFTFSGGRLRFKFSDPRTGDTYQSSIVLTPADNERPAWIENARIRHLSPQPDPDNNDLQDFPEIPSGAAAG
jgi:DNA uptake protein ComE-like DNA-binding protein